MEPSDSSTRETDAPSMGANQADPLPDWCNVYDGLSDEEIADLEASILARHAW